MRLRRLLVLVLAIGLAVTILLSLQRPGRLGRGAPKGTPDVAEGRTADTKGTQEGPAAAGFGGAVHPACRARVHYYDYGNGNEPAKATEAAEDGTFRFPECAAGVLLAEADGFRPCWFAMADLADARLVLEPGAPLPYLVTDPEGSPVAGAWVEVWYLYGLSGHFTRGRFATDANGVVEVNAGPLERFTVTADGFETETIPHPERTEDMRSRTIVLRPLLRIAGRVVDPLGQPVGGAEVRYKGAYDSCPWHDAPIARLDGQAGFDTPPLSDREYMIRAAAEGWAEARAVARPGDAEVVLRLDRPAQIEGRVFLPGGAPAADVELWAHGAEPVAHSAADGTFRLDGIPPGNVLLAANWWGPVGGPDPPAKTAWRCSWPFELKPGEVRTSVEVTLFGACYSWVPLRLVDGKGAPLAGIPVDTGSLSTFGEEETTDEGGIVVTPRDWRTDANGFVLIRTEDAPGYETRFEFPAEGTSLGVDRSCRIRTLAPGTTELITVKLPDPVRVTFIVRDRDGAPIPAEASPTVFLDPGGVLTITGDRVEALVAPDLDSRRVEYHVRANGFASVDVEDWVPNPKGETIEVRMQPAAALRGRVTAADEASLAGIRVSCRGSVVETDDAGAFEFDGLTPGSIQLRVWNAGPRPSLLRRQIELHAGNNDVGILQAGPPETIRGRVADAHGKPLGGACIEILEEGSESEHVATTRPDGVFFLRACEPATVRVIARKEGFGAAVSGGAADLEMTLPEDGYIRLRVPAELESCLIRITLPDGSRIDPRFADDDEPGIWRLAQLPAGPLTIEFLEDGTGRVIATCTDRATVVPRR